MGVAGVTIGPAIYSCRSVPQMPVHSGLTSNWFGP